MLQNYLLFGLLVLMAGGCEGNSPELSQEDLAVIQNLRSAVTDAIIAGDAAAYASLCTEDVRLLHDGSPIITGKEELEAHNAAIFAAVSVTFLKLTPVVLYGTGDLAYEVGTQELTIEPTLPGFAGSRKYIHVLHRGTNGQWLFSALISNNN